jgi:general secretion pathway protein I
MSRIISMLAHPPRSPADIAQALLSRRRSIGAVRRWSIFKRGRTRDLADEAGFTLVEVIVALAMLSLGLGVVLDLISSSLNRTSSARRMAEAGSLAQSLLAEPGVMFPIKAEQRDGAYAGGFRWHLIMRPYDDAGAPSGVVALYRISAEIEWDEGTATRSYALTTLRLGPNGSRS